MIKVKRTDDKKVDAALRSLVRQIEKELKGVSATGVTTSAGGGGGGGGGAAAASFSRHFLVMGA